MTEIGLITSITNGVAKPSRGIRLPVFSNEERQVL
jgi:hypothetical protein